MITTKTGRQPAAYALGHSPAEYERLRAQARRWTAATGRLLDHLGLGPGASCLDAGCGPGETMRAMAGRVGPTGRVLGIDTDAALVSTTHSMLREAGYPQCTVRAHDLTAAGPVPGGPFDLVYARLLLFHLPSRVAVLRRLWDAVAPGGWLLIQDYDLESIKTTPPADWAGAFLDFFTRAFAPAGGDVSTGALLPQLFEEAGIGVPDGTDVAGQLEPLSRGRHYLEATVRSLAPAAVRSGAASQESIGALLAAIGRDAAAFPARPLLWPLMIGAWKRKDPA